MFSTVNPLLLARTNITINLNIIFSTKKIMFRGVSWPRIFKITDTGHNKNRG